MEKNEIKKVKVCVFLEPDDARAFAVLAAGEGCSRSKFLSVWLWWLRECADKHLCEGGGSK